MHHINDALLNQRLAFIDHYIKASNPADGSKYDANANITHKNLATLES